MTWRYAPPPASSFCTEFSRRKVGKSVTGALAVTNRRVDRLEAVTVFDNRQPRGLYLQGGSTLPFIPIDFDADGRILIVSEDGSVDLSREPWGRQSVLNIQVAGACDETCNDARTGGIETTFAPFAWATRCVTILGVEKRIAYPVWICGDGVVP